MADWSGLPTLRQGRAFTEVMPQIDVAAGLEAAMQATAKVAGELKAIVQPLANQEAKEAGATAVTRGEDGKLKVRTRMIFSEEDAVYMNAAESAYLSQMQLDLADQFRELRANPDVQLDPVAFRTAADGTLEGMMEGVPGEFRGSVQELWNREVARNVGDIADTKERVTLQRQKSSIDAGLKMAENDVFALAMQGGLGTEAGREAVARYKSTLEQLRNPIWGVSDEEITLIADETLSVAQGMSAKGYILDVYASHGVEAAEAAAEDFFASADLQLSPSQREGLKADSLQEVRGRETERRSRAYEAKTAASGAMAQNAADLDVAVNDFANGIGEYADLKSQLDAARRNRSITEAKWASATKRLANVAVKREKESAKGSAVMDEGFRRVESGIGFNPKDADDRKIGDAMFQTWVDPKADEAALVDQAVSFTRHQGMVPTAVRDGVRTALYSGSGERQVAAANAALRLRDANPMAADEAFTTNEIERAQVLVDAAANGVEPVEAMKRADDMLRTPKDVREQRRAIADPMFNKGDDKGVGRGRGLAEADAVLVELGADPASFDPTSPTPDTQTIGFARSDFEREFKSAFERTGNLDAALNTARMAIRTRYGATRFGAPPAGIVVGGGGLGAGDSVETAPRLQAYAPEVVYGGGMAPEDAHAWQSEQLKGELAGSGAKPEDYGLKSWDEVSRLSLDPAPGAMANGGLGYSVMGPNGKPVVWPDGDVMIWQPDPAAVAKKAAADIEAATAAARKTRDTRLGETDMPDWH